MGRPNSVSALAKEECITFDAGGPIALERNDRRAIALLARAAERGFRITVPATALAQAIRNPARQARVSRLIRQVGTNLMPLDGTDALARDSYWRGRPRLTLSTLTLSSARKGPDKLSSLAMPKIFGGWLLDYS